MLLKKESTVVLQAGMGLCKGISHAIILYGMQLFAVFAFAGSQSAFGVEFVREEQEANIRPCTLLYADSVNPDRKIPPVASQIRLRDGQEILIFDPAAKKRVKVKLADITVLRQTVREQQQEKEWRWKEGGSNEKLYTGKYYYWRKFGLEVELKDGTKIVGVLASGFMVRYRLGEDWKKLVIKTRDKSPLIDPEEKEKAEEVLNAYSRYLSEVDFRKDPADSSDGKK